MNRVEKFIEENTRNCINTIRCYDKDGNTRVATKEEIEEALNNGVATRENNETYQSLINKYIQDDVKQELDKRGYEIKIAPNKDYQ